MTMPTTTQFPKRKSLVLLSHLLLPHEGNVASPLARDSNAELKLELLHLRQDEFDDMLALANLNHVVVRALETFLSMMREADDEIRAEWAARALEAEHTRISTALRFLHEICAVFIERIYGVAVIKSLDHWPDFGSDLDLYTTASPKSVTALMIGRFYAEVEARSWGDRLANKWNFKLPGLRESVEIHVGRLGQTGEQETVASSLLQRSRQISVGGLAFRVPSVSDRIMISTMQRMYRHFYFRLCDVIDTASLADKRAIDYRELRSLAEAAGIWPGVATYLSIVSDYVRDCRGFGLELPHFVVSAARFGGDRIYYARGFIRVPIMPQSAALYGSQLAGILGKRELRNGARLSLLPWLATAAVIGQKLTGSDKGIW